MDPDSVSAAAATAGPTREGQQVARNTIWSGGGQAVVAAVGVAWLFTVPRSLGPASYGTFVLLSSLIDFHTTACTLGVNNAFAYHFPRFRAEGTLSPFASGYAAAIAAASTLGVGVMVVAAHLLGGGTVTGPMIAAIVCTALLQAGNALMGAVLYGGNHIRLYSLRFALQQIVTLACVLAGCTLAGLAGALVGQVAGTAITTAWLLHVVRPWRECRPAMLGWSQLRGPVSFGLLAVFGSLAGMTITRGGNVILAGVGRGAAEIGSFAVAVGFVLQGVLLLAAFAAALTPGLAGLRTSGEKERAQDWAARAACYQAFLALLGTAFVAFIGRWVLQLALGPRFDHVFPITLLSICGLLPLSQAGLANQLAIAWGHPRLNLENWGVLSGVFLLAGMALAHCYGSLGMAGALVLAAWAAAIYLGLRLRGLGGPNIWSARVWTLLALSLPGALLLPFSTTLGLSTAAFGVFAVYLTAGCFVCRVITLRDVREIAMSLRSS